MRGAIMRLWLLVLAAAAIVDGVQYAGTNCAGIIDFDLVAPMVPELEMTVAAGVMRKCYTGCGGKMQI